MRSNFFPRLRTRVGRQSLRHTVAKRLLNPLLRHCGYTVVADYFYQPIPNPQEVLLYHDRERPLTSIAWDLGRQVEFVNALLTRYRGEFNIRDVLSACGYNEARSGIVCGDAEVLYSLIRARNPQTIIEIGAGGSTQIMAAALKINYAEHGGRTKLISIDPYPQDFLRRFEIETQDFANFELVTERAQDVDLGIFHGLKDNDLLFVDSSHVFKQGSDVEFAFLQVYPKLRKGVIVHIHDIFFPFDYPVEWNSKECWFWNEQYFLETFLQFNSKFQILASLSMISRFASDVFARNVHSYHVNARPASFWMEAIT